MGSLVYFTVSRSAQFGGMDVSRRAQAPKRLHELRIQLSHWRGPAVLADAGEELLVLGKTSEAIAHFQEAKESGGSAEDVNLGLAQALQLRGNFRDAVPLVDALLEDVANDALVLPLYLRRYHAPWTRATLFILAATSSSDSRAPRSRIGSRRSTIRWGGSDPRPAYLRRVAERPDEPPLE